MESTHPDNQVAKKNQLALMTSRLMSKDIFSESVNFAFEVKVLLRLKSLCPDKHVATLGSNGPNE